MRRQYFVYVLTNTYHSVLYTGITNDLLRRVWRHRAGVGGKFTAKYACSKLVYCEVYRDPYNAIKREKQIKAGSRNRKVALIEGMNPTLDPWGIASSAELALSGVEGPPRNDFAFA